MAVTIDLSGQAALVTGSGAGIGREIARWLARAGAAVAVNDMRADMADETIALVEADGGRAVRVLADCRDDAQVEAMVRTAADQLGGLDIAVNNIGMLAGRGASAFVDSDGAYWRDVVEQNLILTAVCAQHQARQMIGQKRGGVLLIVTSGETTRPSVFNSAYAAAKAGLNHLVTSLAMELGEHGIRVNAIAPGTTLTETVRAAFTDEHVAAIVESTALHRMVEPDELGRLSVFLASDLARCVTGQFFLADAGAFLSRSRPRNLRHEETRLGDRPDRTREPIAEQEPA